MHADRMAKSVVWEDFGGMLKDAVSPVPATMSTTREPGREYFH